MSSNAKRNSDDDTSEIKAGLNEIMRWMINDWREQPDLWGRADLLRLIQYGGMYVTREQRWEKDDESQSGSSVRRYARAFKANAASPGKTRARPAPYAVDAGEPDDAA